jgi:hypothetical protein
MRRCTTRASMFAFVPSANGSSCRSGVRHIARPVVRKPFELANGARRIPRRTARSAVSSTKNQKEPSCGSPSTHRLRLRNHANDHLCRGPDLRRRIQPGAVFLEAGSSNPPSTLSTPVDPPKTGERRSALSRVDTSDARAIGPCDISLGAAACGPRTRATKSVMHLRSRASAFMLWTSTPVL